MRVLPWLTVAVLGASASPARAQSPSPENAVAAEALFAEGRRLLETNDTKGACEKFAASQALDPGVGTLLNWAECLRKDGRTASAWARFREAAAMARAAGQTDREGLARARATELEPELCRLTVQTSGGPGNVFIDGKPTNPQLLGTAIPVDPGVHRVEGVAHDATASEQRIVREVTLFPANGHCPPAIVSLPLPQGRATTARGPSPLSTGDWLGIGFGAGAVALAGAGAALSVIAVNTHDAAEAQCSDAGCPEGARSDARSAGTQADIATGLFIGAGVFAAAGLTLWLTWPESEARVGLAPGGAQYALRF